MARIRFDFESLALEAELLDTPTARALAGKLPFEARAMTWGEEVYFDFPARLKREADARAAAPPGEIACWPDGLGIAIGFGPTPVSQGDECRLAGPCNIFARATSDVKALSKVRPETRIRVSLVA